MCLDFVEHHSRSGKNHIANKSGYLVFKFTYGNLRLTSSTPIFSQRRIWSVIDPHRFKIIPRNVRLYTEFLLLTLIVDSPLQDYSHICSKRN